MPSHFRSRPFWLAASLAFMPLAGDAADGPASPQTPPSPPADLVEPGAELTAVYRADGWFFEGPSWHQPSRSLFFTAFHGEESHIYRLDAERRTTTWTANTGGDNGTCLDRNGRLLGAAHRAHRVTCYEIAPDGPASTTVALESPDWNQPNDVFQAPNGDLYFTDPNFGDTAKSNVYVAPMLEDGRWGEPRVIIDDMALPNGIVTSLNGRTLYVGDSRRKHWRCWPILPDGSVGEGRIFFAPQTEDRSDPDGMTVDEHGNLYFTGLGGVWAV